MRALVCLLLAAVSPSLFGQNPPPYTASIVMEPETRLVLHAENAHQKYPIASMTKMMTLMIVLDEIEAGRISWDDMVTVSAKASKMGGSQVYLRHNEQFSVEDLVAATMVHSANDAAMSLAEHIAGSDERFVEMMNRKAQQMGLKNTEFHSPHGLPAEGDQIDDQMSPYDLAILGSELMKNEKMRELAATQTMPFRNGEFIMYNPNHLIRNYPNATGIKTGFHDKAGFCVTASAREGDLELVAVVVGSKRKADNFSSAERLFRDAFAEWEMRDVVAAGELVGVSVPVAGGKGESVPVKAAESVKGIARRSASKGSGYRIVVKGTVPAAPLSAGDEVGTIIVSKDGKEIGRAPAVAAEAVEQTGWLSRTWRRITG